MDNGPEKKGLEHREASHFPAMSSLPEILSSSAISLECGRNGGYSQGDLQKASTESTTMEGGGRGGSGMPMADSC